MSVLIIGVLGLDSIQTKTTEFNSVLGGAAAYASLSASLFCSPSVSSIVGSDFPSEYIDLLNSKGIDLRAVQLSTKRSFCWSASYKGSWEDRETISVQMNALVDFKPVLSEKQKEAEYVLCTNFNPKLQLQFIEQLTTSKLIVLDTINHWILEERASFLKVLGKVDVLIVNESEIELITQQKNLEDGMKWVIDFGPSRVIIKRGELGALMYNGTDFFNSPAYKVSNVVDPTGAGDSFAGAFLGSLSHSDVLFEDQFHKAVIMGNSIASFTIQGFGVDKLGQLTKGILQQLYKNAESII